MILTLILSALAGALVKPLQPRLTEAMVARIDIEKLPDEAGRRIIAFAVALAGAAIVLGVLNADPSPVLLLAGGVIGYFQAELREAFVTRQA